MRLTVAFAALLLALTPHHAGAQTPVAWAEIDGQSGRATVDLFVPGLTNPGGWSGSEADPPAVPGGGAGQAPVCTAWAPVGPIEEVNRAIAAAAAEQVPSVDDPTYTEDVVDAPQGGRREVSSTWYRWDGSYGEVLMSRRCDGSSRMSRWFPLGSAADGGVAVRVTAADLLPDLHVRVVRQLPTPLPRIGPADEDDHGYTYVNNRTFFWVDQAAGQWHPVTATASAAGISVTAVAEPVSLRVDPGDGHAPVTCPGAPVPVARATYHPDIEGCAHTYTDSSAMAPNGETFTVGVAIVWHVTWSATTGEGGDLGYVSTTSATRDLPVAESQAIVVGQDP